MMDITQEELKALLHYDQGTGVFTWAKKQSWAEKGSIAGYRARGYILIRINKKSIQAHRLAWLYIHGFFPKDMIDHINRNRSDNRICNLREATNSENQRNSGIRVDNTSGIKGVRFHKKSNRWVSQIKSSGKQHYLGSFRIKEDAAEAYAEASRRLHGEFANIDLTPL